MDNIYAVDNNGKLVKADRIFFRGDETHPSGWATSLYRNQWLYLDKEGAYISPNHGKFKSYFKDMYNETIDRVYCGNNYMIFTTFKSLHQNGGNIFLVSQEAGIQNLGSVAGPVHVAVVLFFDYFVIIHPKEDYIEYYDYYFDVDYIELYNYKGELLETHNELNYHYNRVPYPQRIVASFILNSDIEKAKYYYYEYNINGMFLKSSISKPYDETEEYMAPIFDASITQYQNMMDFIGAKNILFLIGKNNQNNQISLYCYNKTSLQYKKQLLLPKSSFIITKIIKDMNYLYIYLRCPRKYYKITLYYNNNYIFRTILDNDISIEEIELNKYIPIKNDKDNWSGAYLCYNTAIPETYNDRLTQSLPSPVPSDAHYLAFFEWDNDSIYEYRTGANLNKYISDLSYNYYHYERVRMYQYNSSRNTLVNIGEYDIKCDNINNITEFYI